MQILMAASEVYPYAKTGGLADVVGSLSQALNRLGVRVAVVLPYYKSIERSRFELKQTGLRISVPLGSHHETAEIWSHDLRGVSVFLVKCDRYFDRENLYGTPEGDYPDNAERFIFFSRAVLETARAVHLRPDLIHCHDWHTGLVPILLSTFYRADAHFESSATLFTIHNLGYQGIFWHYDWPLTGLPWSLFTDQGAEFFGKINCMKAGLVFSDLLNTVSPRYAREIQTPEFGFGLDGVLRARSGSLFGILNGIDVEEWDPSKDPHLPRTYGFSDLSGKGACKEGLQKELGLPVEGETPILSSITRLTAQKGLDLLLAVFDEIMALGTQFVLLGSGDKEYEDRFKKVAEKYPLQVHVRISYDNRLAHRIEAGSDVFIMPSRYEPCGLNQMMSLRYGTVPLVRATGGLDDSVRSFSPQSGKGNGFKFKPYEATALLTKTRQAVELYPKRPQWHRLMQNGMLGDYSWDVSAKKYLGIYRLAQKTRQG